MAVAAAGDPGVAGGSSMAAAAGEGAEVAAVEGSGSGVGGSGRPLTPTVEELFAAAERASDGGIADLGGEEVVVGQFSEMPVLRTATVLEPRSGDSGIGSSRHVPFADGDFLEDAERRDVLDALGLDFVVAAVLRDASTPEDRASASLLGDLLSEAGSGAQEVVVPEAEALGGDRVDDKAAAEVRVIAVDEAKAYLEEWQAYLAKERPEFTPAAYAPRLHLFEPVGMTAYVPGYADYSEEMLLQDRASHISSGWVTSTTDVYGHGGSASSLAHFRALPERVRALVEAAGFGPFVQLLTVVRVDRVVLTALAERWWDTTNTFHFWFGEMTVTPLDFAAITGLRVGGDPIPYDSSLVLDDAALRWFLGRVPCHSGGMAAYGQFVEYWDHEPATDEEAAQMARAYLLYLFGASLLPNRRSRVHLCYLAGLVDLGQAGRFDWGGAALCMLYCLLGAASRGVGDTVGWYWRVFELWAYEVLGMFPPENTCTDSNLLPCGLAWGKAYRRAKERRGEVMTFRRWLDNLTGVVVRWDRWAGMEADFLPRSREVTRSRVLLECPLGWQWYLGDRVTR
ncbi:protein MAINTENANCE OF MERISTEMS-like [Rhododendron vialii]|uniref:protein MAINTENANCE OF MERISTEMS-like n=1 Tax=Rhododendron vialii TaxID=182163 RepID=UPI00265F1CE4|nr:protein MAINTENANCE OF MERISTEMS-like [Rhododendron vialii]